MKQQTLQFEIPGEPYSSQGSFVNPDANSWRAFLSAQLIKTTNKTICVTESHFGPLRIQKPFYPEIDGAAHIYLLHPPGGLVGGDRIQIALRVGAGANALVTTPGAGKFYETNGKRAEARIRIDVAKEACVEWLPQETIYYESTSASQRTRIDLQNDAKFIGWDITCLGRQAERQSQYSGHVFTRFELWRDGVPLLVESNQLVPGDQRLAMSYGWAGHHVAGTMVISGCNDQIAQRLQNAFVDDSYPYFAVTVVKQVCVIRYLGHSTAQARERFIKAWKIVRPLVLKKDVVLPRIWNT